MLKMNLARSLHEEECKETERGATLLASEDAKRNREEGGGDSRHNMCPAISIAGHIVVVPLLDTCCGGPRGSKFRMILRDS